jgi:hypothetical protein
MQTIVCQEFYIFKNRFRKRVKSHSLNFDFSLSQYAQKF